MVMQLTVAFVTYWLCYPLYDSVFSSVKRGVTHLESANTFFLKVIRTGRRNDTAYLVLLLWGRDKLTQPIFTLCKVPYGLKCIWKSQVSTRDLFTVILRHAQRGRT